MAAWPRSIEASRALKRRDFLGPTMTTVCDSIHCNLVLALMIHVGFSYRITLSECIRLWFWIVSALLAASNWLPITVNFFNLSDD